MPREDPPVFRSAHGVVGIDSATRRFRFTTHRHRPSPLPCSVLRIASKGTMPRSRTPCRIAFAS
jgi:hypothetical protein